MPKKIRVNVTLDEKQLADLKTMLVGKDTNVSQVLRQLIAEYLKSKGAK